MLTEDYIDALRVQLRFVMRFEARDLPKRLASACLVSVVAGLVGAPLGGALCLAFILVMEAIGRALFLTLPVRDEDVSRRRIFTSLAVHATLGASYCLPAAVMVSQERVTGLVLAFIWISSVTIHNVGAHVLIRLWNWVVLLPVLATTAWMGRHALGSVYTPALEWDWLMLLAGMIAFVFNVIEVLARQSENRHAFSTARAEASNRLERLEFLNRHDSLTGLLNRAAFDDAVSDALLVSSRPRPFAVLLVDLDGFKPVNDTYGHAAGDAVLREIGGRLRQEFPHAQAARFGGDEFAILLPSVGSEAELHRTGAQLAETIRRPFSQGGRPFYLSGSIGMVMARPGRGTDTVSTLLAAADQAMYLSKQAREGPVLYSQELFGPRLGLEDRRLLETALAQGEIVPHYQPKLSMADRRIEGFEALARWVGPNGPVRLPAEFLPTVWQFGLARDFTLNILTHVLDDLERLHAEGLDPGRFAVNLPEAVLASEAIAREIELLLDMRAGSANYLTFEITEDVFLSRAEDRIRENIRRFSQRGVRISLDDFGTGYASFRHLKQLHLDELKIDASFVAGLGREAVSDVLVEGFLYIAKGIGVQAVAEGIETELQARRLQELGYHLGQGYHFGRAEPFEVMVERLRAARRPAAIRRPA